MYACHTYSEIAETPLYHGLKSKVGLTAAKAAALRIHLIIDRSSANKMSTPTCIISRDLTMGSQLDSVDETPVAAVRVYLSAEPEEVYMVVPHIQTCVTPHKTVRIIKH